MSEIVYDEKLTTLELVSDLGLNLPANNPRIKHTGTGTLLVQSTIGKINLSSGSTAEDSLNLDSYGGVDIDAVAGKDVNIAGGQVALVSKDNVASALSLTTNIGTSETIVLTNTLGTSESAITLNSMAGGVDIDAVAGKDVNIAGGQVALVSKDNASSAISLTTNIGTLETINFINVQGIRVMTDTNSDASIQLHSTAGGIGLRSTANLAGSIQIEADGGTNETIVIHSDRGTGMNSINLVSDAGGITMTVNNNPAMTIINDSTIGINTSNPNTTYDLDVNGTVNTTGLYQNGSLLLPPGCISPYAGSTAPGGWLLCDGTAHSRSTYAALFALIGTSYGSGNGSTTFNVPNLKDRFVLGKGDTYSSLGGTGGSSSVTLTTDELPAHTHTGTTNSSGSHTHTTNSSLTPDGSNNVGLGLVTQDGTGTDASSGDNTDHEPNVHTDITALTIDAGGAHTHTFTTDSRGSGQPFEVMNPYIILNYIIKV